MGSSQKLKLSCQKLQLPFRPLRRALPGVFPYALFVRHACPTTPRAPRRPRFGLAPFRSPLLGGSLLFSFPPTTGMFRFVGFASPQGDAAPPRGGLPHSDTCGSTAVRASPQTFAACRVLPRLREPRHPPCALARFSLSLVTRSAFTAGRCSLVCRFVFVSAFTFPSCQRTARVVPCGVSRSRGECGARTHDPRLAKPVL